MDALRAKEETISILQLDAVAMNISIPLFSIPLLASAVLILLGLLVTPFSVRLGVIGIGAGSVILGLVAIKDLPNGLRDPDYCALRNNDCGWPVDDLCRAEGAAQELEGNWETIICDLCVE